MEPETAHISPERALATHPVESVLADGARRGGARQAWLDAGLHLLTLEGAPALTIERLCAATGRTRGSFYHHFAGVDAFAGALLQHWRETCTEDLISIVDRLDDAWERRVALDRLAVGLNGALERAVRRWSATDRQAESVLKAVDARRLTYLADTIQRVTGGDDSEAADLARIEYAACIGFDALFRDMAVSELERLVAMVSMLTTPRRNESEEE